LVRVWLTVAVNDHPVVASVDGSCDVHE
jgi:hypothetical protein